MAAKGPIGIALVFTGRVIIPLLTLSATYLAAYVLRGEPITILDNQAYFGQQGLYPSAWLSYGHLALMLGFFAVMLTNRMFGPSWALLQVVLAWLAGCGIYLFAMPWLNQTFHLNVTLPGRSVFAAFLSGLGAAHVLGILVFDSMRGPAWWRAPLLSGIISALILCGIYWGVLRAPAGAWISRLSLDVALKVAVAFLLLAPYALVRPLAKPRDGFGGY